MTEEKRGRPKAKSSLAEQELDKAQEQFKAFDDNIKELTLDRMNAAPKADQEPQTKLSQRDIEKSNDVYIKPKRSLGVGVHPKTGVREVFNEKFRDDWNFAKEYVQFVAEHKECPGDMIQDMWTKPFQGVPVESWDIPTGVPVWAPRYVAEQIKSSKYHRLKMDENRTAAADGLYKWNGVMTVDTIVQRLDAMPVATKKSIFMGARSFA